MHILSGNIFLRYREIPSLVTKKEIVNSKMIKNLPGGPKNFNVRYFKVCTENLLYIVNIYLKVLFEIFFTTSHYESLIIFLNFTPPI